MPASLLERNNDGKAICANVVLSLRPLLGQGLTAAPSSSGAVSPSGNHTPFAAFFTWCTFSLRPVPLAVVPLARLLLHCKRLDQKHRPMQYC
jgi:hypothetical protein